MSRGDWFGNVTYMIPDYGGEPISVVSRTKVTILILPRDQAMAALRQVGTDGMLRSRTAEKLEEYCALAYERAHAVWDEKDML